MSSRIENLWSREMVNLEIFNLMESRGILINQNLCHQEIETGVGRMAEITRELGGKNPNSNKDLYQLLIVEMGLPVFKVSETSGKPSFDKEAMKDYELLLQGLESDLAKLILEYRGWSITSALCYKKFVENVSPDGRLRTNYQIHGTRTSRTSAKDPNLQQVPKEMAHIWNRGIKECFVPEEGYELVQFDFSQGEMRLAAGYANQKNLIETFINEEDVWAKMVEALGRPKNKCKTLHYAKMYGAQTKKLTSILGGDDPVGFIRDWENYHDRIVAFSEYSKRQADKNGQVKLWTGRIRHTALDLKNGSRTAFNSILQGGLAEIVKSAMIRLYNEVDNQDECRMLLMVHDSVIFEIRKDVLYSYLSKIKEVMERVSDEVSFNGVPFTVEHEFWGKSAA